MRGYFYVVSRYKEVTCADIIIVHAGLCRFPTVDINVIGTKAPGAYVFLVMVCSFYLAVVICALYSN